MINTAIELLENKRIELGFSSVNEIWESLLPGEDISYLLDPVSTSFPKISQAVIKAVTRLFPGIVQWMGGQVKSISAAGIYKQVHDRLGHSYIICWVKYKSSTKVAVIIYCDGDGVPGIFIPRWGNTVNAETLDPIGWDSDYWDDIEAWSKDYSGEIEYVCDQLGEDSSDPYHIYYIIHEVLFPDIEFAEREFKAYIVYA